MFRKMKPGVLLVILVALVAIYFLVNHWDKSDRTFKSTIMTLEPKSVTEIVIQDPKTKKTVDLKKTDQDWKVLTDGEQYNADSNVVRNILTQLSDLKTKQYAGKGEQAWIKYEVTDTSATKVTLNSGDKKLAELMIGKFSYVPQEQQPGMPRSQQPEGDMTTFVRVNGENQVYAVDGFLKMNFNRDANSYRDKTVTSLSTRDMTRLVFTHPDEKISVENTNGQWTVNGAAADSASTMKYLNSIAHLNNTNFTGNIIQGINPEYTVMIEGNNFQPVTVSAYPVADTNINYVITSTMNPGSYFNGKKNMTFEKLFERDKGLLPAAK